ncbi:hypothetical protein EVAR_15805_1 [Eumeta japonica]|uniref:Uncharacterized protein n=1 Tax=Eumeta variegata TaxID=151549 RepID=A0A4C1U0W7_EUMVA|nr:hypothetical protein EVAR_15805_1 [Eumeta japonica]
MPFSKSVNVIDKPDLTTARLAVQGWPLINDCLIMSSQNAFAQPELPELNFLCNLDIHVTRWRSPSAAISPPVADAGCMRA